MAVKALFCDIYLIFNVIKLNIIYFRVVCAILVLLCCIGTCYDGFQRFLNAPYDQLKEDNYQDGKILNNLNNQSEVPNEEDKVETMRVNFETKRKIVLTLFFQ